MQKSKEVQDALHEKMRASYKLDDYLAFFSFTGVSFVHSHLPKYDPWEWYENGDMMFDGKKAKKTTRMILTTFQLTRETTACMTPNLTKFLPTI